MTDRPPSIQRRHFLTAAGTTGLAGLAGCSALVDSEQPTDESSDLADESPTELVEQYLESIARQRQLRERMYHSQIDREFDLEIRNTSVVEEDLSTSALRDRSPLPAERLETIANEAETAVVEAEFAITNRGDQNDETVEFVLATEGGDWRLLGGPSSGSADGASGSGGEESDSADAEPSPEPGIPETVHAYLVENETNGYDGALVDRRGDESVTIEVGTGANGFAFSPPVVKIETGTEVVWEWTGNGGAHNVVSAEAPEEFSSPEVVAEDGYTWSRVFETAGNYTYHCEPHYALGMHAAIIVE